jgi:DNA (cytosine-5)-methyltransferase 1
MLTHLSLFSGIGGIDLAAEWAGFKTVAFCDNDKYCQRVLKKHWPDVPIIEDVKDVTREKIMAYAENWRRQWDSEALRPIGVRESEPIALISGGFPCQPHSVAGSRKGSGDERNLWPEFRRIISEIRPRWVLGENVPGIFTSDSRRFFGGILADLAALGYAVGWQTYGAVDVGALHRRNRVFIVGHSISDGHTDGCTKAGGTLGQGEQGWVCKFKGTSVMGDSNGNRCEKCRRKDNLQSTQQTGKMADTNNNDMFYVCRKQRGGTTLSEFSVVCQDVPNADSERGRSGNTERKDAEDVRELRGCEKFWYGKSQPGLGRMVDGFSYWMDEPVPRVATGVKDRVSRLKCLGNAVVPQQVYPVLKSIADYEIFSSVNDTVKMR